MMHRLCKFYTCNMVPFLNCNALPVFCTTWKSKYRNHRFRSSNSMVLKGWHHSCTILTCKKQHLTFLHRYTVPYNKKKSTEALHYQHVQYVSTAIWKPFNMFNLSWSLWPEISCVCVLRPVFAFCVLRHVRRKNNVRHHLKHGIY